jgi:hypothetical protein
MRRSVTPHYFYKLEPTGSGTLRLGCQWWREGCVGVGEGKDMLEQAWNSTDGWRRLLRMSGMVSQAGLMRPWTSKMVGRGGRLEILKGGGKCVLERL